MNSEKSSRRADGHQCRPGARFHSGWRCIDPETERQREEKTSADLARTEQRLAQVQASQAARRPDTDKTIWAAATTDVAREFTAELDALSPAERQAATNRIAALASVAEQLLSGQPLPPTILNPNAQA